jgi:hypothetical protein
VLESKNNLQLSSKVEQVQEKVKPAPVKRKVWRDARWLTTPNCGHVVLKKPTLDDYDRYSK